MDTEKKNKGLKKWEEVDNKKPQLTPWVTERTVVYVSETGMPFCYKKRTQAGQQDSYSQEGVT